VFFFLTAFALIAAPSALALTPETGEVTLASNPEHGAQLRNTTLGVTETHDMVTLAEDYLWGLSDKDVDIEKARQLLEQAAELGNLEAHRILGEQYLYGTKFAKDRASGLALLEKAAQSGSARSQVSLGDFLLNGTHIPRNKARALELFEAAAALGDGAGLELYGKDLMWNRLGSRRAETYLLRAAELGRNTAWTTLAEGAMYGYLGKRSRAKFANYAQKAMDSGQPEIAVLEAHRRLWGISMRASGPEAIAVLERAVETDNEVALKFLISLVRDGNRWNVHRDRAQARTYLQENTDLLTRAEIAQYEMSFDVSKARGTHQFESLAEIYFANPEWKSAWFGRELFAANPNFAMYLLQSQMKKDGEYFGSLNGFATPDTLRAIWRQCRNLGYARNCGDIVLKSNIVGALLAR